MLSSNVIDEVLSSTVYCIDPRLRLGLVGNITYLLKGKRNVTVLYRYSWINSRVDDLFIVLIFKKIYFSLKPLLFVFVSTCEKSHLRAGDKG